MWEITSVLAKGKVAYLWISADLLVWDQIPGLLLCNTYMKNNSFGLKSTNTEFKNSCRAPHFLFWFRFGACLCIVCLLCLYGQYPDHIFLVFIWFYALCNIRSLWNACPCSAPSPRPGPKKTHVTCRLKIRALVFLFTMQLLETELIRTHGSSKNLRMWHLASWPHGPSLLPHL